MTPQVLPQFCARSEAADILIAALVLYHRSGWAAPGGAMQGRAIHLTERLHAYLNWHRLTDNAWPSAAHLSLATEVMLAFSPDDGREKKSASPWVTDTEFAKVREQTQRYLSAMPEAFSAWSLFDGQASVDTESGS